MRWIRKYLQLRTLLLIAWIAFVWFGYRHLKVKAVSCPAEPASEGVSRGFAKRLMPPNWRVGSNDIDWGKEERHPDFTGKYAVCKIDVGQPVTLNNVGDEPIISPADGRQTYLLRVTNAPALPQDLNADMHLEIF